MPALSLLHVLLTAVLADQRRLALENLALRQRVAVPRRGAKRPFRDSNWSRDDGAVQARPVLGGLHHVYSRAA